MSATNLTESGWLTLMFINTAFANVGNAGGLQPSGAAGSFYVSLHTADPGETGTQTTSETSYTGYLRSGGVVARSGSGWTVSGTAPTQVANAAVITYAQCTAGSATISHTGIGSDPTGAGNLFFKGTANNLAVSASVTPTIAIGACVITLD